MKKRPKKPEWPPPQDGKAKEGMLCIGPLPQRFNALEREKRTAVRYPGGVETDDDFWPDYDWLPWQKH